MHCATTQRDLKRRDVTTTIEAALSIHLCQRVYTQVIFTDNVSLFEWLNENIDLFRRRALLIYDFGIAKKGDGVHLSLREREKERSIG